MARWRWRVRFSVATVSTRAWFQSLVEASLAASIQRQHRYQRNGAAVTSVVELFLEYSAVGKIGLQKEDLADFLLAFVLTPQDTSAVSMSWLLLMLTKHPEVDRRIRDEMATLLPSVGLDPSQDTDVYLTTDHVQKLVYLEATIREVLRLYPVLSSTRRGTTHDTAVCGGRVALRMGEIVMLSMYAMARNPGVWGSDAAEFKPSRWINSDTTGLSFPPTQFATFGAGPRMCLGMKLAMLELRVTVANLLCRYKFKLATLHDGRYAVQVTMAMLEPLVLVVQRATNASWLYV